MSELMTVAIQALKEGKRVDLHIEGKYTQIAEITVLNKGAVKLTNPHNDVVIYWAEDMIRGVRIGSTEGVSKSSLKVI